MTAIRATYSDLKLVKTRKVLQLIFEVPIEEADNALRVLGGMPRGDAETWVGIALITEEAATRPTKKPRRPMSEVPRSQQAGILCKDDQFHQFLERLYDITIADNDDPTICAAEFVCNFCKVDSRTQLDSEPDRGNVWDGLRAQFDAWAGRIGWPDEERSAH